MAETVGCPNCQRKLQVPEQYLGQKVQCPECQHLFIATTMAVSAQPIPAPAPPPAGAAKPRRYEEDDDEDLAPRRRRSRDDDDDDDFDEFHRPRHLRNRFMPHRGGMIMAMGLVALVGGLSFCLPAVVGPVAWALGTWDLREIREGRKDPEGESMTRAGQVCGIVASVLMILGALVFALMILSELN